MHLNGCNLTESKYFFGTLDYELRNDIASYLDDLLINN